MEAIVKRGSPRVDVDLPPGLRLGGAEGGLDSLSPVQGELPPDRVVRADRDLARYMGILFKPVEQELCIAFRTTAMAKAAQKVWQRTGTGGKILAFGGGGAKRGAFGDAGLDAEAFQRSLQDS